MKTFEIGFKLVYGETSEWGVEIIRAVTKRKALHRFARLKHIRDFLSTPSSKWDWSEGVWRASFRYVKEARFIPCPHCEGSGLVSARVDTQ